ncbi:MAG TPA: response regulator [Candidatus Paceibacterota bacterium]
MAKVLLVEDDAFLAALFKNRLIKEGYDVLHAKDGVEAVEALKKEKPDLMLLDLILPKMSGFEVLEVMQTDPQLNKVPTFVLSNLGQDSDMTHSLELGAIKYFVKTKISISSLMEQIQKFLSSMENVVK